MARPDPTTEPHETGAPAVPAGLVRAHFDDLGPAAQIREIALRLFAENGIATTSMRMVAAAAGVSPGAVVHHYKTKPDLEKAVQASVVAQIRDAIHGVGADQDLIGALTSRRQAFDELIRAEPHLAAYLRHLMASADTGSVEVFRMQIDLVRDELGTLVTAGLARPFDDPELGVVLYWLLVSSRILIRPLIEAALGLDLSKPEDMRRLDRAEIDLLTRPLFPPSQG